jgi:hypothetical protein
MAVLFQQRLKSFELFKYWTQIIFQLFLEQSIQLLMYCDFYGFYRCSSKHILFC